MSPSIPTLPLNDKREVPAIAFGTGTALYGRDATSYVVQALEGGFNHIDTAQIYKNEESVGQALREAFGKKEKGGVVDGKVDVEAQTVGKAARDEIWVTTKYGGAGNAEEALDTSLKKVCTLRCCSQLGRLVLTMARLAAWALLRRPIPHPLAPVCARHYQDMVRDGSRSCTW